MNLESDFTQYSRGVVKESIQSVIKNLRRLADEIETTSLPRVDTDPTSAISSVIHTVSWGVANLSLDILVSQESQIHKAREFELEQRIKELEK